jgi:hypothetical protein
MTATATVTIHGYTDDARGAAGYKKGQQIMARVVRLLHRAQLAVEGFDTVSCEHETTDSFRDEDFAGKPKRHFVSTFRIITEAVPTWLMPYLRPLLALEFVPAIDDATGVASTGGAFSKVGTPTLESTRESYLFDVGDYIALPRAAIDRVINGGASGFAVFVAVRAVTLVGSDYTLLTYTDPSSNGALQIALVAGADGSHVRVSSLVSYDPAHYESLDNAGNLTLGAHVIALRYRRTATLGARLDVWADGVPISPAGTPSADPGGDPAGVIDTYPDGAVYLGDNPDPNWGSAPNSPAGGVWGVMTAPTDAEMLAISQWIAANHAAVAP